MPAANAGHGALLKNKTGSMGLLKKPGDRKKQVQARGKLPRSQSLFFTAFALLVQLIEFFNSPINRRLICQR